MSCSSANTRQWLAASIASVGLFMTGMFLGWPSPVVSQLREGRSPLSLTAAEVSWAVSLLYLGSLLSPLAAGTLMDRWGRRGALRATAVVALVSWLLLVCSTRVEVIYVARVLGGMWGGLSYAITPIYLCEIADPKVRGALNTMFTLMFNLGIMFEYTLGAFLPYNGLNIASCCVPVAFVLSLSLIPESPYFFIMWKRTKDAEEALQWLRCTQDVKKELETIEYSVRQDLKNKGRISDLVRTPGARRALFMTEMVAFLQRNSGSSVMTAYISTSLPKGGPISGDQCAIVMCGLYLIFGVLSTFLVDRLGRRPLLAVSCVGCSVATGFLTAWFYMLEQVRENLDSYNIVPYASFGIYALFYPLGLACIPSIIQGELFPANVKGIASGLTAIVVAFVSFVTNKLYQPLSETCGTYTNYLYFTISSAGGIFFAIFILIETRNKTLQEINFELNKLNELSVDYETE
ncbi:facilitated trehalose transporter Tret1-like [Macrosteles quadrilineatus]|uniref:facilitated trehalose transporter Tret1-like n=1 Tax=Macrosteles quadrilineatus TaxID=74068 RepID=UPI0023E33F44|nr:facilitated trehalose transporter Tret1-like [Macrosteles quadrilineatus]